MAINYLPAEQPDAEEVKELIEAEGRKAVLIPGDLSDESFCQNLVKQAHNELGGLDVLALVAGKQQAVQNIEDLPTEQIYKTFEVNVFSLYWVVKAALPYLPEGASIITTTSVEGYNPSPMLLDYAATKNAIIGFTVALGKQLAPKGIRVNSVAPGPIWTQRKFPADSRLKTFRNSARYTAVTIKPRRPAGGAGRCLCILSFREFKLCDISNIRHHRRNSDGLAFLEGGALPCLVSSFLFSNTAPQAHAK